MPSFCVVINLKVVSVHPRGRPLPISSGLDNHSAMLKIDNYGVPIERSHLNTEDSAGHTLTEQERLLSDDM